MNEVVHTSPTIGSNVEEIVVNNTHFLMWDIGGQESLRSSWNTYYTNTEVREYAGSLLLRKDCGDFCGSNYIKRELQTSPYNVAAPVV